LAASTEPLLAYNAGNQVLGYISINAGGSVITATPAGNWIPIAYSPPATTIAVAQPSTQPANLGYLSTDGHVHQLTNINTAPSDVDLTATNSGSIAATAGSSLASVLLGSGSSGPTFYYVSSGHIIQLRQVVLGAWSTTDLSVSAHLPAPAYGTPLSVYAWNGTDPRLYYLDANSHIQEVHYSASSGWGNTDVTLASNDVPCLPGSPITVFQLNSSSARVYHFDTNYHVREVTYGQALAYGTLITSWSSNDLSGRTGAAISAPNSGLTSVLLNSNSFRIYYNSAEGHVRELSWSGGWSVSDVSASAGAPAAIPGSALTSAVSNGVIGVFYFPAANQPQELLWHGSWSTVRAHQ
jgi:hypothetical protein